MESFRKARVRLALSHSRSVNRMGMDLNRFCDARNSEPDPGAQNLGMLCHLLALFTSFVGPLALWLIKREETPFVEDQGRESLNFQITVHITGFILFILSWITFGILGVILFPLLLIVHFACTLAGSIAASQGKFFRYPVSLRLLK